MRGTRDSISRDIPNHWQESRAAETRYDQAHARERVGLDQNRTIHHLGGQTEFAAYAYFDTSCSKKPLWRYVHVEKVSWMRNNVYLLHLFTCNRDATHHHRFTIIASPSSLHHHDRA